MKIFIDADGCPVVDIALKVARKYHTDCIILCDTAHEFQRDGAKTVTVPKGADSVDFALVNRIDAGDVAVTQDYGLAAMCLAKGAIPIRQDGVIYTSDNIDALLLARHTAKKIRRSGGRLRGAPKRTSEEDLRFQESLERILREGK